MSKTAGAATRKATSERTVPAGRADRAADADLQPYSNDGNLVPLYTLQPLKKGYTGLYAEQVAAKLAKGNTTPLSMSELAALKEYTANGYRALNAALRRPRGMREMDADTKRMFRLLNSVANGSKFGSNGAIYRGVGDDEARLWLGSTMGSYFRARGLYSTSTSPSVALGRSFGGGGFDTPMVLLKINVLKGQRGVAATGGRSAHPEEHEFILPHGSIFRVVGKKVMQLQGQSVHVFEVNLVR